MAKVYILASLGPFLPLHASEQHHGAEVVREDVEVLLIWAIFERHGDTRQFWPNRLWLARDRHASRWKPAAY